MTVVTAAGSPPADLVPPPQGRRRVMALLSAVFSALVLGLGGWYVVARWDQVSGAVADIGAVACAVALLLTVVGVLATGQAWRVWLGSLADPPGPVTTHQLFYLTQSGKYLPGSLWPYVTQVALARRFGIPRRAMLTTAALFMITHVVTGAVVGLVGAGSTVASRWAWLLYPAALVGLAVLAPPVLRLLLSAVDRRRGLTTPSPTPSWRTVGRAVAVMMLAWLAFGGATWVLVAQLAPGAANGPLAIGVYALSWVVGFLAIAAPAGVGAREAVLVVALGPLLGAPAALSVALVLRLAVTVADLGLAAASTGVLKHLR